MTSIFGQYQNNIPGLNELEAYRYENIFKVYQDSNNNYFYNIVKQVTAPTNIDPSFFDIVNIQEDVLFPTLSYQAYGTTYLWWLICTMNGISNPFDPALVGQKVKILKKQFVKPVLDSIVQQLQ